MWYSEVFCEEVFISNEKSALYNSLSESCIFTFSDMKKYSGQKNFCFVVCGVLFCLINLLEKKIEATEGMTVYNINDITVNITRSRQNVSFFIK